MTKTIITLEELAEVRTAWDREGTKVVFVPTMGALHEGHMALVKAAKSMGQRVMVSIFVNPTQFGPGEDFAKYPRTLENDIALLNEASVDALFLPNAKTMYPDGFQTFVENRTMAEGLCGRMRPGHFDGVLTVVLKLFNLVKPHMAIFGKKDYQQWRLIERMVRDLNLSVEVVGLETVREADGLAMSSRNRYLSQDDRKTAVLISRGLKAARGLYKAGERRTETLVEACFTIMQSQPGLEIEYLELRSPKNLVLLNGPLEEAPVLLVAARIGATRLIDNMEME